MNLQTLRTPPDNILASALATIAERDSVLRRRVVLLGLLWDRARQTQTELMARICARLGRACFGRQPELAFRRDVQFIRTILARAGQTLKYSRSASQAGYYIVGQSAQPSALIRAITGAANELDHAQIVIWARLTPAARLRLADALTHDVLSLACQAQRRGQPGLSLTDAQREVLHRHYEATSS